MCLDYCIAEKDKMFTNRKRIIRLLIISVLMNFGLFAAAYCFNLPLWLDTTGTIYISAILGAPVGFLAAIINNSTQAILFYGSESLPFYFVSLLTAYIVGLIGKKYRNQNLKKWLYLTAILILVDSLAAVGITFLVSGGVPSNYWSKIIYDTMTAADSAGWIATSVSVLAIKIPDVLVSVAIAATALRLTPRRLKTKDEIILKSIEDME